MLRVVPFRMYAVNVPDEKEKHPESAVPSVTSFSIKFMVSWASICIRASRVPLVYCLEDDVTNVVSIVMTRPKSAMVTSISINVKPLFREFAFITVVLLSVKLHPQSVFLFQISM